MSKRTNRSTKAILLHADSIYTQFPSYQLHVSLESHKGLLLISEKENTTFGHLNKYEQTK